MNKYICIHGHFYQPPRENPWIEEIEVQESAAPFHDWNERIDYECYKQNAFSRILDKQEKIEKIVNNYSRISFNFGATLFSWIARNDPATYEAILEADKLSRELHSGHGSAVAQAYNHIILPLANRHDKETQVIWGIRDFQMRFKRCPEGMWLPETAVDTETLEVLAENDIKFTILSPHQAKSVCKYNDKRWKPVKDGKIDPRLPYNCSLPSGRSIALFFYNGSISQAVAFERLLNDGAAFARKLLSVFTDDSERPQLGHIAADGESYGHHHRFGDMALAFALEYIEKETYVKITNYGEFLEKHPPEDEVRIEENTSWSCCHGIERWQSDCGCNSGGKPGWRQKWRAPLRNAMNWLRDSVNKQLSPYTESYFKDPWIARNEYIEVILDRSEKRRAKFLNKHAKFELTPSEKVKLFKYLELQRFVQFMFTSCGWFFDDISNIETIQIIAYAARAIAIAADVLEEKDITILTEEFLHRLESIPGNDPDFPNALTVYEKKVKTQKRAWKQIAAELIVKELMALSDEEFRLNNYSYELRNTKRQTENESSRIKGEIEVKSEITNDSVRLNYFALYLNDLDIFCGFIDDADFDLLEVFARDFSGINNGFNRESILDYLERKLGSDFFIFDQLGIDLQTAIIRKRAGSMEREIHENIRRVLKSNRDLVERIENDETRENEYIDYIKTWITKGEIEEAINQDALQLSQLSQMAQRLNSKDTLIIKSSIRDKMQTALNKKARILKKDNTNLEPINGISDILAINSALLLNLDIWEMQNYFYEINKSIDKSETPREWIDAFCSLGGKLGFSEKVISQ